MSRTYHHGERRIRVKGVRRHPPDLKKLARAFVDIAQAQAEAEAESQDRGQKQAVPVRAKQRRSTSSSLDSDPDLKREEGGSP
jgi:hypothetical protein